MSQIEQPETYVHAQEHFLRAYCDQYFPMICDLAVNGNASAVLLLIFSARRELQTPRPVEDTIVDYFDAMKDVDTHRNEYANAMAAKATVDAPPGDASASG